MDKPFSVRDMPVTNSGSSQGLVNNLIQQYNTPQPPKPVKGGFSDTMSQTTSFLNEFATDKTIRDTHTKLNDGTWVAKYESYSPFRDNEAYHAENQTTGDKWANGAIKFLGKTGTAILGGTIGTVYGFKEMLREGSLSALYDNDLSRKFDDWNVTMDIKNPNYYTQSEQDLNFFQSMGTANFWANDFLGGLSFTVGALGSEIIWGTLTGGASLATAAGRWGAKLGIKFGSSKAAKTVVKDVLEGTTKKEAVQAMENSMFKNWSLPANVGEEAITKSAKQASVFGAKAGALANTIRFGITSAGYESSVEALQLKKELQDNFYDDFQRKNGRVPTSEEITSFNEKVNQASDGLFFYNLALVGASNTAVLGKIFDIKNPLTAPSKWVNKKVFGVGLDQATNTVIKANRAQKVMQKSYSILSPMFMEGVVEEGGQAVGSGTAKSWVEASYDPKYTKDSLTLGDAFIDSLVETYTTKEGWKEIGLGALIGALSGGAGSVYNKARGRESEGQFTRLQREANEMMAFNKDYSPHSMANMLVYANRVQNANQAEDVAEQEGNFTLSEKVRRDKALAQLSYAYNLDFFSETVDQTIKGLNALDEVQLAEERGVSVEEARAEKEKAIEDYTQIAKEFKLNRDFADSFFGDVLSREGLDYVQTNTLKEAVAYELTQGSRSWEFSRDLLSAIQTELSGVIGAENVLRIGDVLNQATPEVKRELDQVTKELFENESKLEELNTRRKNVSYVRTNDIEVNRERANTANNLALDIAELTERKQQLENRYNILLETANLNNPFTNESSPIVTTADILNLEQSLNKIKASANSNNKLKGLIEEYQRVSKDLVRHSILNKQLKDPKLQAEGSKGLSRLLLGKGRKLNDLTKEFIEGIQSSMDYVREVDTATKLRALETVDESIETVQEAETIQTQPTQQQEEISQAQQIINANIAYFQPVGIQTEEDLNNTFPTQEEIAKFETLYNKAKYDENFSEYDNVETIESGALTEAEQARFNELYDKLEKWQMLQVAENEEGVSLADIVQQTYQNSQVGKAENQEVSLDEFSEIVVEGTTAQAADRRTENLSQTPDGVQVRESKGKYTVHNISLPAFLSQVGSQDIVVIEEDGEYQVLPQAVDSTPGTKVRIDYSEDQHTVLTVGEGGVIEIENEIPLFNNSNYSIVSYSGQSGSSYSPLYEKTSGNPVLSDFNQDGTYNPQAIYNLNQGDVIYFRVDMDNSYNQGLKGQSDEYIEKQVKVFLVDQSGNILGDLKAHQNVLGSDGFNTVRRLALEQFKAGKSGNLPVTSKVNSVILGVPNFTLNEEGLPSPKNFNSDNVVDWGYWDGKKFNLRNGTNEVRETFTKKFKRNVPVVVFSIGNQLVAFPINLRSTAQPSNINLLDIINDESQSLAKQVIRINELLISRGFSGNLKYLGDDNQNIFSNVETQEMSEEFKTAQENLNTVQAPPNIIDMDMAGLAEVAITPIDFSNRPLMSPRIAIDLKVGQGTMEETVQVVENEKVVEKPNPKKVTQEVNKKVEKVVKQTNSSVPRPTATQSTTETQKAEIEKELFSETDNKGRTFTYYSTTKEKNGKIIVKFLFNRSDKDSSQRATAVMGVPVEKALGDKYTIDETYIPEGAKVVGVSEIRITKEGAGATVTFEVDGERYQGEVKLNSNTTYDVELAALGQTQPTVSQQSATSEQKNTNKVITKDTIIDSGVLYMSGTAGAGIYASNQGIFNGFKDVDFRMLYDDAYPTEAEVLERLDNLLTRYGEDKNVKYIARKVGDMWMILQEGKDSNLLSVHFQVTERGTPRRGSHSAVVLKLPKDVTVNQQGLNNILPMINQFRANNYEMNNGRLRPKNKKNNTNLDLNLISSSVPQQPTSSNITRKVMGTDVEYTVKPFSNEDVETINNIRHLLERGDTVFPNGSSGVYEYNGTTLNLVRGNGAPTLTNFSKGMKIYKSQFNSQKELESGNTIEPDQSLINQSKKEQNKNCKN